MGGGRQFAYPKWVWTPAGGWWPNPTHWKRNTIVYGVFVATVSFYAYRISEKSTKTYSPPLVASAHKDDHDDHHH